jgi:CBS domain-containing protein
MQIRDIMSRYVEVVARDADVRAAAVKMRDLNVTAIPVCDGAAYAGLLTERDIAVRLAAEGYDATRTRVGEIMTRDLTYCFEDQAIGEAAMVMEFHQINRLPVLDRDCQLVGVVSLRDISRCLEVAAAVIPLKEIGPGAALSARNPSTAQVAAARLRPRHKERTRGEKLPLPAERRRRQGHAGGAAALAPSEPAAGNLPRTLKS